MFIPVTLVPVDKVEALKAIAQKPHSFYSGTTRSFLVPGGEEYLIDTRYDADLREIGLLRPED